MRVSPITHLILLQYFNSSCLISSLSSPISYFLFLPSCVVSSFIIFYLSSLLISLSSPPFSLLESKYRPTFPTSLFLLLFPSSEFSPFEDSFPFARVMHTVAKYLMQLD